MDAASSALDELDSSRVLHPLGALAIDLQDLVSNLEGKGGGGRGEWPEEKGVGGGKEGGLQRGGTRAAAFSNRLKRYISIRSC